MTSLARRQQRSDQTLHNLSAAHYTDRPTPCRRAEKAAQARQRRELTAVSSETSPTRRRERAQSVPLGGRGENDQTTSNSSGLKSTSTRVDHTSLSTAINSLRANGTVDNNEKTHYPTYAGGRTEIDISQESISSRAIHRGRDRLQDENVTSHALSRGSDDHLETDVSQASTSSPALSRGRDNRLDEYFPSHALCRGRENHQWTRRTHTSSPSTLHPNASYALSGTTGRSSVQCYRSAYP